MKIEAGISCDFFHPWIKYLNDGDEIDDGVLISLRSHVANCKACHDLLNEKARDVIGF